MTKYLVKKALQQLLLPYIFKYFYIIYDQEYIYILQRRGPTGDRIKWRDKFAIQTRKIAKLTSNVV